MWAQPQAYFACGRGIWSSPAKISIFIKAALFIIEIQVETLSTFGLISFPRLRSSLARLMKNLRCKIKSSAAETCFMKVGFKPLHYCVCFGHGIGLVLRADPWKHTCNLCYKYIARASSQPSWAQSPAPTLQTASTGARPKNSSWTLESTRTCIACL